MKLFMDQQKLLMIKEKINSSQKYRDMFGKIKNIADANTVLAPYTEDEGEQNWQRQQSNKIPFFALCYLITGEDIYLKRAIEWSRGIIDYKTWGLIKDKTKAMYDYSSLPAGHHLTALAIAYDWLRDYMDDETEEYMRVNMKQRMKEYYYHSSEDFEYGPTERKNRSIMQNHLWIAMSGILAVSLAVDEKENGEYIEWVADRMRKTLSALGSDGASHEGVGYWQYGLSHIINVLVMLRDAVGIDLTKNEWLEKTAFYQIYMMTPAAYWHDKTSVPGRNDRFWTNIDFADCPRYNWCGPDYILRFLASEYNNGYAQYFADMVDENGIDSPESKWQSLIFYNENVKPIPIESLDTTRHFKDMGLVVMHSDWKDGDVAAFKCAPSLGHYATDKFRIEYEPVKFCYDMQPEDRENVIARWNQGHTHFDAGSFCIFGNGEWLVPNQGYTPIFTQFENTLLVDGKGQGSHLDQVTYKLHPRIISQYSAEDYDYICADVTDAYPMSRLHHFIRRFIYFKERRTVVVFDDIASLYTGDKRSFELYFHLEDSGKNVRRCETGYIMSNGRTSLRIKSLSGADCHDTEQHIPKRDFSKGLMRKTIIFTATGSEFKNGVAFSWAPSGAIPEDVRLTEQNGMLVIGMGGDEYEVKIDEKY